ncbi:hypothetical protein HDU67_002377, partial [Dinochytrium kinnereticum]
MQGEPRPKLTFDGHRFPILESIHRTLSTPYAAATVASVWSALVALNADQRKSQGSERKRKRSSPEKVEASVSDMEEDGVDSEAEVEERDEPCEATKLNDGTIPGSNCDHPPPHLFPCAIYHSESIWHYQSEQERVAFESGCRAVTDDTSDMTQWNEVTYNAGMEAVADMWEPNRRRYGVFGWYGWDQEDGRGLVERPKKFVRIHVYEPSNCVVVGGEGGVGEGKDGGAEVDGMMVNCTSVEEGEAIDSTPPFEEGKQEEGAGAEAIVGATFTIGELLDDVSNIPDAELNDVSVGVIAEEEEDEGEWQNGPVDMSVFGMEVERDVVYDESELSKEEIEIQRWSISWRKYWAEEKKRQQDELDLKEKEEQENLGMEQALAAFRKTHEYKSRTYGALYGDKALEIIALEDELEHRFLLSGGYGTVGGTQPIGEGGNYSAARGEGRSVVPGRVLARADTVVKKQERSGDAEEGELEEGEVEEGEAEIVDDGEVGRKRVRRVLWPVLPIRWLKGYDEYHPCTTRHRQPLALLPIPAFRRPTVPLRVPNRQMLSSLRLAKET